MLKTIFGFKEGWHSRAVGRVMTYVAVLIQAGALVDWSPLISLIQAGGFTVTQVVWLAGSLLAIGLMVEVSRLYKAGEP